MSDEGVFHLEPLPTHCELCFQPMGDGKPGLVGGLHLCALCDAGAVQRQLAFRGFQFAENVEGSTGGEIENMILPIGNASAQGETFTIVAAQVIMARQLPVEARFNREQDGGSLLSLFKRELQVGDDLFDKSIYVESNRDELTQKLLSSSGLQSAIMEVVLETGQLRLGGPKVWTQGFLRDRSAKLEHIRRALAVVAHYLDIFCQHLERPDDVAWP